MFTKEDMERIRRGRWSGHDGLNLLKIISESARATLVQGPQRLTGDVCWTTGDFVFPVTQFKCAVVKAGEEPVVYKVEESWNGGEHSGGRWYRVERID